MEFKAGDTVKILDRVGDGDNYYPRYTDGMLKYAGTLATITGIIDRGSLILDNNNYFWDTKAVQLANGDKYLHPTELKDGDFIKIWNDCNRFIYIFKEYENNNIYRYVCLDLANNHLNIDSSGKWSCFCSSDKITYATEEEKTLLNKALLKEGYIWDFLNKRLIEICSANLTNETSIGTVAISPECFINNCIETNIAPVWLPQKNYNIFCDGTKERPKEELNLFPTKKHYQLNFNY